MSYYSYYTLFLTFGQVTRVDLSHVREVPRQVHLQLVGLLSECPHHLCAGKTERGKGRTGGGREESEEALLHHLNVWSSTRQLIQQGKGGGG